ncbi:MAG: hypothetical protein RMI04_09215 [Thermofilaceae archaeon]|nr:hypothetical protein [Thermofilaceae archaeon]
MRIEKVRRELKEIGGLKCEGEEDDYNSAREKLYSELDKLVAVVAKALSKQRVVYDEIFIDSNVDLSEKNENIVKKETINGYILLKLRGKKIKRARINFTGEIERRKRKYFYRATVKDVEERET